MTLIGNYNNTNKLILNSRVNIYFWMNYLFFNTLEFFSNKHVSNY